MQINNKGLDIVKQCEGIRLQAYKCPAGVWTIGYGHTKGVYEGMKITKSDADKFLLEDIRSSEKAVENLGLNLNENQFSSLVSFTFNCGAGNLRTLVKNRSLKQIADAMLLYCKGGGRELPGLKKRRQMERELFLTATDKEQSYTTLRFGSEGNEVKKLQLLLGADGYYLKADGKFGNKTLESVKAFQAEHGLVVDGIVGVKTWDELYK